MDNNAGEDDVDLQVKKEAYREEAEEEAEEDHLSPSYAPILASCYHTRIARQLKTEAC